MCYRESPTENAVGYVNSVLLPFRRFLADRILLRIITN